MLRGLVYSLTESQLEPPITTLSSVESSNHTTLGNAAYVVPVLEINSAH